jgi:hypothetical protein
MAATINADNGVVSGTSGLKSTADTSGVLALQSNGSTALSIGTNLNVTLTNPLPVASGGTGATSLSGITAGTATNLAGGSNGTIPYQSASGTTQMLAAGTSGQVLTSNGAAAPTWATPAPGAGTVTAVASGALSDGSMVVLNSNGTVSVITGTVGTSITQVGSSTSSQSSTTLGGGAYNPTSNNVFLAWRGTSNYLYGIAGSISGNTITFGSAVTLDSGGVSSSLSTSVNVIYCSVQDCFVVMYATGSNLLAFVTATVAGSGVTQRQSSYQPAYGSQGFAMAYDTVQGRLFCAWYDTNTGTQKGGVGAINNTNKNVTLGGITEYDTTGYGGYSSACYEPVSAKIVLMYRSDGGFQYVRIIEITSNTSYTAYTRTVVTNWSFNDTVGIGAYYTDGKVIICAPTTDYNIRIYVGTISGTSISVGSGVPSGLSTVGGFGRISVYSLPSAATFIANGSSSQQVTVSGSTPSLGSNMSLGNTYFSNYFFNNSLQIVNTSFNSGTVGVYIGDIVTSSLTSTNFLGVSNGAYTNGQTATIQTVGSTDDAQSGLTPGLKYYVTGVGSLSSSATSQPYAGLALSATKLVIKG